jgi:hypothetical protein
VHFSGRLSELSSALIFTALSFHLLIWPGSVAASSFHRIVDIIDPAYLSIFFGLLGSSRLAALVANGAWPQYGPWMRAIGAFAGAMIFGNMSAALYINAPISAGYAPSPGIPVYLILAVIELLSMYKALALVGERNVGPP